LDLGDSDLEIPGIANGDAGSMGANDMKMRVLLFIVAGTLTALSAEANGLSDYDRQIVASCMVLEAGCDGAEGMQAVLNVILNRADGYLHRLVPETVKHGAFSCMSSVWRTSNPDYSPLIRRAQNETQSYNMALRILATMERGLLWDNTYGATHYHATYIRPYWVTDMSYITTIGGHHFYIQRNAQRHASL
jgi:spore germination cell wall hydrolase CwlJ-like protein